MQELFEYHQRTQTLLSDLLEGKVSPSLLVITQEGWQIKELAE